jgi:hypothetical protein
MRPNPLFDAASFLTKVEWTTGVFWLLFLGSAAVAFYSWQGDPAQRSIRLVSHLQLIAMERCGFAPQQRVPFFVYVDEFQTFSSDAFASLLSEARKCALHFALANQYTDQLSNAVRSAVIGNAGTLIVFRVGSRDSELLAPEFRPMDAGALADQEPFTAWLRRGIGATVFLPSPICMIRLAPPR